MKTITALIVLCTATAPCAAFAEEGFSGKEAAYIDWSVKNCELASTAREHTLVDQTKARNEGDFNKQWTSDSYKLLEAPSSPKQIEVLCTQIKDWYGPLGTQIPGLVRGQDEYESDSGDKPAPVPAQKGKGKRHQGP